MPYSPRQGFLGSRLGRKVAHVDEDLVLSVIHHVTVQLLVHGIRLRPESCQEEAAYSVKLERMCVYIYLGVHVNMCMPMQMGIPQTLGAYMRVIKRRYAGSISGH